MQGQSNINVREEGSEINQFIILVSLQVMSFLAKPAAELLLEPSRGSIKVR